ncbi:MAG TPA: DNA mismatch repair protein MutS, partial [Pelotomaculum sp.]|nr:DNA mismatch repair protein MutS [Pelotomaculum sp.]
MKPLLMYKDHDFDLQRELPANEQAQIQDLELNVLFNAMALGDDVLFEVTKKAVLSCLNDLDKILYRQYILKDCLKNPSIVRDIYAIAVESIESERKNYFSFFSRHPSSILHRAIEVMQMFLGMLKKLRNIADKYSDDFTSEGFTVLFAMLKRELDDEYFAAIQNHLKELKFNDGVLISAELGKGNKGINYILRKPKDEYKKQNWIKQLFAKKPKAFTLYISERDESGARALSELKDRGINLVANALAQSTDHILSFFKILRTELAFYIGCLNLYGKLTQKGEPVSFPL